MISLLTSTGVEWSVVVHFCWFSFGISTRAFFEHWRCMEGFFCMSLSGVVCAHMCRGWLGEQVCMHVLVCTLSQKCLFSCFCGQRYGFCCHSNTTGEVVVGNHCRVGSSWFCSVVPPPLPYLEMGFMLHNAIEGQLIAALLGIRLVEATVHVYRPITVE